MKFQGNTLVKSMLTMGDMKWLNYNDLFKLSVDGHRD